MEFILGASVECPSCGHSFEGKWEVAGEHTDQPCADQTCPSCGCVSTHKWPGFTFKPKIVTIARDGTPNEPAPTPFVATSHSARSDIIAFGYARLDEEESVAKAVRGHPGPWVHEEHSGLLPAARDVFDACGEPVAIANGSYLADHIVLHDAARTIRDIEHKRAILAAHEHRVDERHRGHPEYGHYYWCYTCSHENPMSGYCQTVRLLVARWDDHPEYEANWKP